MSRTTMQSYENLKRMISLRKMRNRLIREDTNHLILQPKYLHNLNQKLITTEFPNFLSIFKEFNLTIDEKYFDYNTLKQVHATNVIRLYKNEFDYQINIALHAFNPLTKNPNNEIDLTLIVTDLLNPTVIMVFQIILNANIPKTLRFYPKKFKERFDFHNNYSEVMNKNFSPEYFELDNEVKKKITEFINVCGITYRLCQHLTKFNNFLALSNYYLWRDNLNKHF